MAASKTIDFELVNGVWVIKDGPDKAAHTIVVSRIYLNTGLAFHIGDGDTDLWVDAFGAFGFKLRFEGGDTEPGLISPIPSCRVYNLSQQSIPDSVWTSIAFDAEDYDEDDMHDNVTNNTRLTAVVAGRWLVGGQISFTQNSTGIRGIRVEKNGTTTITRVEQANAGASDRTTVTATEALDLVAGDYIEIAAWQSSGAALDANAGPIRTHATLNCLSVP